MNRLFDWYRAYELPCGLAFPRHCNRGDTSHIFVTTRSLSTTHTS